MSGRPRLASLVVATALTLAACPGTMRGGAPHLGGLPTVDAHGNPVEVPPPPPPPLVEDERTIEVTISDKQSASLGALYVHPRDGSGPTIVIVPGAGDVSRKGTRPGDGVVEYAAPVDVSLAWAEAFARRGARVLTWDKRTCGPNDDPMCKKNPEDDVDAEGPGALAKDVDAACALARSETGFNGQLVLFAHAQAAQVALSSACAKDAAAIVLLAPIPRAIDEVIVAALKERTAAVEHAAHAEKDAANKQALLDQANQLKNLAGTREAELQGIKGGRFAPTAKVRGATIAFWKGWMDLTSRTAALVEAVAAPKIVVLGSKDAQYGDGDRVRIRALAPHATLEIKGADHHLLTDGKLADSTVDLIGKALDAVLLPKG